VSTEGGMVFGFDSRNIIKPVFEMKAHEKACSSFSFSPHIPSMMATASTDEFVKVWDISANGGTKPKLVG
jgi:periodic tryptophan protein 1